MSFDREEFSSIRLERAVDKQRAFTRDIQAAEQAVPPMESLTGDANWNLYLSLIEAKIQKAHVQLRALQEESLSQSTMAYEDMVLAKTRQLLVRQAIETYQECRDIPKILLEQGREAKRLLREHDVAS
jgi:hypothetical protein